MLLQIILLDKKEILEMWWLGLGWNRGKPVCKGSIAYVVVVVLLQLAIIT